MNILWPSDHSFDSRWVAETNQRGQQVKSMGRPLTCCGRLVASVGPNINSTFISIWIETRILMTSRWWMCCRFIHLPFQSQIFSSLRYRTGAHWPLLADVPHAFSPREIHFLEKKRKEEETKWEMFSARLTVPHWVRPQAHEWMDRVLFIFFFPKWKKKIQENCGT